MDAVIFDFDGTLLRSEEEWDKHLWPLVQETFPGATWEEFVPLQGMTTEQGYAHMAAQRKPIYSEKEYWDRVITFIPTIYQEAKLNEGVADLLEELWNENILMGIATSSLHGWIKESLRSHNIEKYFSTIITLADVAHPKPAPDPYILAAQRLTTDPYRCIVFEDSRSGVKAAKSAGMYCIGFEYEYQKEIPADYTIQTFREVDTSFLRSLLP